MARKERKLVRLPNLGPANCGLFVACGDVKTADKNVLKWLKVKRQKTARVQVGGYSVVVRLFTGDSFDTHFHVDLATTQWLQESLPKEEFPKQTHRISEILEDLERVLEQTIELDIEGSFRVPIGELPQIIQVTLTPTKVGELTIRMSSGSLSVEGAPVHIIRWQIPRKGNEAVVVLKAKRTTVVTESYLEDSWQLIESAFNALIRGRS